MRPNRPGGRRQRPYGASGGRQDRRPGRRLPHDAVCTASGYRLCAAHTILHPSLRLAALRRHPMIHPGRSRDGRRFCPLRFAQSPGARSLGRRHRDAEFRPVRDHGHTVGPAPGGDGGGSAEASWPERSGRHSPARPTPGKYRAGRAHARRVRTPRLRERARLRLRPVRHLKGTKDDHRQRETAPAYKIGRGCSVVGRCTGVSLQARSLRSALRRHGGGPHRRLRRRRRVFLRRRRHTRAAAAGRRTRRGAAPGA